MSVKDLIEDKDSEIFLMSLPSIDTHYVNIDLLKQVYDGLLKKWFSMKEHKETIEEYWVQVSDKDMADAYIKHYYGNIIVDFYSNPKSAIEDNVNKYICFFVTPMAHLDDYMDDFCIQCQEEGYITCDECDDYRGRSILYCDVCEDTGLIECPYCEEDPVNEFLVGAVCWYSFKNPYTDENHNAMFIDSILYFGRYEFLDTYGGNDLSIASALNQNDVSDDVNSAQIWTQLSQIDEIKEIVSDSEFNTSYYGLITSYSDLLKRIEVTSGIKISQGFQSYKDSNVKF